MKVSELTVGQQLDTLVALAQGMAIDDICVELFVIYQDETMPRSYQPSTNGEQAFELIEKFKVDLMAVRNDYGEYEPTGEYEAEIYEPPNSFVQYGKTHAEAICKAVVTSKFGDELQDEIWEQAK